MAVSNDILRRLNKDNNTEIPHVFPHIVLPYQGTEGNKMVQMLKKYLYLYLYLLNQDFRVKVNIYIYS